LSLTTVPPSGPILPNSTGFRYRTFIKRGFVSEKSHRELALNECLIVAALKSAIVVYKRLGGIARQLELTSATRLKYVRARLFSELKRSENFSNGGVNTDELIEIGFSGSHFYADSKTLGNFTGVRR